MSKATNLLKMRPLLLVPGIVWIAALFLGGERSPPDLQISTALAISDTPELAGLTLFVTHLGGWIVLSAISLAATAWLLAVRRGRDAIFLLAAVYGGRALVDLQKWAFARPRPDGHQLVEIYSMSFPSGHSANALITYLALALIARSWTAAAIALLLSVAIGISRIMLGVHWFSDVIGGWAFALFWIGLLQIRRSTGQNPRSTG